MSRIFVVITLAGFVVACGGTEPQARVSKPTAPTALMGAEMVEASEVKTWSQGQYLIVDVRGAEAYEAAVIPGAIPVFFERLGPMYPGVAEHPKENPVLIVAESDQDALRGAQMLAAAGYVAKGLVGGVAAWEQVGLPIEKKSPN